MLAGFQLHPNSSVRFDEIQFPHLMQYIRNFKNNIAFFRRSTVLPWKKIKISLKFYQR